MPTQVAPEGGSQEQPSSAEPLRGRRRVGQVIAEIHYRLRTEGQSPAQKAWAVALGTLVGCVPIYGLHLVLCAVLARLLSLSRMTAYLAAHINNPLTAPFLLYVEYGLGHFLFTRNWPRFDPASLRAAGLGRISLDVLAGALVLGLALGALLGGISYAIGRRWRYPDFEHLLREAATEPFARSGIVAWEFARGKLRFDPVYLGLLRGGDLPPAGRLLDLGCGQGLLLALLRTAARLAEQGAWPADWPEPPRRLELTGYELRPRRAEIARRALGGDADIRVGDLRTLPLPAARAVVLLDVLHYLPRDAQDCLVERVAQALEPGGVVLIREADAARGARFVLTRLQERLSALARGDLRQKFHYRSLDAWAGLLERRGLVAQASPMWAGTPYANVLLEGRKPVDDE